MWFSISLHQNQKCVAWVVLGHGQPELLESPLVVTFRLDFTALIYRRHLSLFHPLAMRASSCPAPPHLNRPIIKIRQTARTAVDGTILFLGVDMPIKCQLHGLLVTGLIQIPLPCPKIQKDSLSCHTTYWEIETHRITKICTPTSRFLTSSGVTAKG